MTGAGETSVAYPPGWYVKCPRCRAGEYKACKTSSGGRVKATGGVHPARLALEATTLENHSAMVFIK